MEGNQPTQEQSPNQPLTEQQVQEQLTTFLNDPAQREKARIQCAFLYQVFKDKEFSVQALPVIFQCSIKHAYDVIVVLRSFGYAKLIKDHKKPFNTIWQLTPTRQALLNSVTKDIKLLEKKLEELIELKREILKDERLLNEPLEVVK
jgi:hypothetical protein